MLAFSKARGVTIIRDIIVSIRDNIPAWVQLHGFGIKLTALSDLAIYNALYSVDSGAWDYVARWKKLRGEETSIPIASINAATAYIEKINQLHEKHPSQSTHCTKIIRYSAMVDCVRMCIMR